jgi:branched-chain amino acid transport system permease protein
MFLQQILSGLANGLIYALLALGFTTIYRTMRLINFAQGAFFMAGGFIGLMLARDLGLSFAPVLLITCAVSLVLGILVERCALAPFSSSATDINLMIRTIGVSVLLEGAALLLWGTEEYRFPPLLPSSPIALGGLSVPAHLLYIGSAAVLLVSGLAAFLRLTDLGLCMRAASQDRLAAEILGINVRQVRTLAFGISSALAGAAGVLIAPLWYVHYTMGFMIGLKGFTAAIIGSLGSLPGAVFGGLLLGVIENLAGGYISSVWKDAIVFSILIAVLAFRPQGLFVSHYKARA